MACHPGARALGLKKQALGDFPKHEQSESDDTPLDPDEAEGLIPGHVQTQSLLNQWEALNIAKASHWASRSGGEDWLSTTALKELHRRMFGQTWTWAGAYRKSDKNLTPYCWSQVPELLENLVANTRARYETSDKSPEAIDDIALRFHHELVHIHPWPNGNGRHGRLATDLLLRSWGREPFTWGRGASVNDAELRTRYVTALRSADSQDYSLLKQFVRG